MTSAGWFVLAAVVGVAGAVLLVLDSRRRTERTRTRREWAASHGMRFTTADPVITAQWGYGVFAHGGAGRALDLTTGQHGGATLHLLDLEQRGTVVATLVALRRPTSSPTVLELRLASSIPHSEAGIDLLGPVGQRYAFTSDLESARRVLDQRLVVLGDAAGSDVPVLWGEGGWALAALEPTAGPQRWDETLGVLTRFADLLRVLSPAHQ